MDFKSFLQNNIVILDGGMGTMLQKAGLKPGELPERWNILHPEEVKKIHRAYFDAGSNVVCTNTFGANRLKYSVEELSSIIPAAVENAKNAVLESNTTQEKFVALDIGPTGKLLKPLGDLDFEDAVSLFAEQVKIGAKAGVDLVIIETMNDSFETKAALLAVKENCSLPVIVSNAYGEDGKLMTGASPEAMVAMLEGMGADAIGVNCSLGPKQLKKIIAEYIRFASVPVTVKPNAGLPREEDGKTIYDVDAKEFALDVAETIQSGVRVAGGCCGTTPEYISELCAVTPRTPILCTKKNRMVISSYTHAVTFGKKPLLIGERINPTGKKRLKQAITENDFGYILTEAIRQQERGAHILDVNVGLPDINETKTLLKAVCEIQSVCDLPLQIDTSSPDAMEAALRRYNGKPLINSVNGKEESMSLIFPLMKKYGGVAVALTLDENGIPADVDSRIKIAKKILDRAEQYGIDKKDIIFDTLTMTVSAEPNAAITTLDALRRIRNELNCYTVLGVSNVSFGLPSRSIINSTFFASALENGLSAAIMNPDSDEMMNAYYSWCALNNLDENFASYISFCGNSVSLTKEVSTSKTLYNCVLKGLKDDAKNAAVVALSTLPPLKLVNEEIIPALDEVGKGFENKTIYLPQLLMSAEAAKYAFEEIKKALPQEQDGTKCRIILATVKGDIHDIGKNIVKLLLQNYGFAVTDLGRDVAPEEIVEAVKKLHAPIVGLSALMTTTVPAMAETVALLRQNAPWCKIAVGGAVLTDDYAKKIGADKYCRDAMETVRYAEEISSL